MKTLMRKLIAAKPHTYGTRQLVAGDEYEASRIHSRVLVAAKLASYAPEQPERPPVLVRANRPDAKPPPSPEAEETAPDDSPELAKLRHRAASLGVEVDARWGVNRLNREITQATARSQQQGETRR